MRKKISYPAIRIRVCLPQMFFIAQGIHLVILVRDGYGFVKWKGHSEKEGLNAGSSVGRLGLKRKTKRSRRFETFMALCFLGSILTDAPVLKPSALPCSCFCILASVHLLRFFWASLLRVGVSFTWMFPSQSDKLPAIFQDSVLCCLFCEEV